MKKFRLFIFPLVLIFHSCVLQDHYVVPSGVPDSVKKIISDQFPGAADLHFSILEKDRVYEASFKINGKNFSAITNSYELLNSTENPETNLPENLKAKLDALPVAGGIFKNYRITTSAEKEITYLSDYVLNGDNYTLIFNQDGTFRNMVTMYQKSYPASVADVQEKIQLFFSDRDKPNPTEIQQLTVDQIYINSLLPNKELIFNSGTVYVFQNTNKYYKLNVRYYEITSLDLSFDNSGNVINSGSFDRLKKFKKTFDNHDNPDLAVTNISNPDQLIFRNAIASRSYWKDLDFDNASNFNWNSEYASVRSYALVIQNSSIPGSWLLYYDANKNLIFSIYQPS